MHTFKQEIKKIVEYHNSIGAVSEQKSEDEVNTIVSDIIDKYEHNSYNFAAYKKITIKQGRKKRDVMQYEKLSAELVLSIYLKRCLDKEFKIRYPNRNEHMHSLFGLLPAIKDMKDYVIVKFDFEDFFNSISSIYVFKKYIANSNLLRFQKDLLNKFVSRCHYCYAGISISNILVEIISRDFDQQIYSALHNNGLIFYKRYVDDGILIFNKYIDENEITNTLKTIIKQVFRDSSFNTKYPCKTKLNMNNDKFTYIAKRLMSPNAWTYKFNYLGYEFELSADNGSCITNIKYGITDDKIQKYTKRIHRIIEDYQADKDIEYLRHRLRAFCCRTVYRRKKYQYMIWKSKGFIANYCELRYHMDKLNNETKEFLMNGIINAFNSKMGYLPYFLKDDKHEHPYSLYNTLERNRTLIFDENPKMGIGYDKLRKMCRQIGIIDNGSYNSLLREYLIKVKVGH